MSMRKLAISAVAATGLLATALPATAQTLSACGGDVRVTGSVSVPVDPFAPSGSTATGTITVQRNVGGGGAKTNDYYFYFTPQSALPAGTTISYNGGNILNPNVSGSPQSLPVPNVNSGNPPGTISTEPASPSDYLHIGFGGASQPDVYNVSLTFNIGVFSSNLYAGPQTIPLNVWFVCKGTGKDVADITTITEATTSASITFEVLSGLQAFYSGQDLAFGEIGTVTNAQASSYTTPEGQFSVKSSGAFTIDLSSTTDFLLHYSGGSTTPGAADTIKYALGFANQTVYNGSGGFSQVTCQALGVGSFTTMPIQARLIEGGSTKTPSTNYQDILSVTFTPLVSTNPGITDCSNLSDPSTP